MINTRIGETNKAKNGLLMTIIAYRQYHDIDVQFEDGLIVYHKTYHNFIMGTIKHPNYPTYKRRDNSYMKSRVKTDRIGKTNKASNGMLITIIAYRHVKDIDVQFEDGYIVLHTTYDQFKTGHIKHKNSFTNSQLNDKYHTSRVGETNKSRTGLLMTIIVYRSNDDIDIKFEDGYIVKHKTYRNFQEGTIKHPILTGQTDHSRYGDTILTKQGFIAKVVKYIKFDNISVKFDTGLVLDNLRYDSIFQRGYSGHTHPLPYLMNNIEIEKPAYIINNQGNFYCTCTKCGHTDIWTVEEAKRHVCE